MSNNQMIGKEPGDVMKIAAIITVIASSIFLTVGTLFSIITILLGSFIDTISVIRFDHSPVIHVGAFLYQFSIFILMLALLNIPSIILNILLLNGKLKSSTIAGIFAIIGLAICFIGIVTGILILLSKFEDEIDNNSDQNFLNKNFNIPKWRKTKPKTASSWKTKDEQLEQKTVITNNNPINENEVKKV